MIIVPTACADGSDHTADINVVVAAANAANDTLMFPPGRFVVSSLAQITTKGGVIGSGAGASTLITNAVTGRVMDYAGDFGCVRDLGFDSGVTRMGGGDGLLLSGDSASAANLLIQRQHVGVRNVGYINLLDAIRVFKGTPSRIAPGSSGVVNAIPVAGRRPPMLRVSKSWVASYQYADRDPVLTNDFMENAFVIDSGEIDLSQSEGYLCNTGVFCQPVSGQSVVGVKLTNCALDSLYHFGLVAAPAAGGTARWFDIDNCFLGAGYGGGLPYPMYFGGVNCGDIAVSNTTFFSYNPGQGVGAFLGVGGPINADFCNNKINGFQTGFWTSSSQWSLRGGEVSGNTLNNSMVGSSASNYIIDKVRGLSDVRVA
jgi:hypothetical protein